MTLSKQPSRTLHNILSTTQFPSLCIVMYAADCYVHKNPIHPLCDNHITQDTEHQDAKIKVLQHQQQQREAQHHVAPGKTISFVPAITTMTTSQENIASEQQQQDILFMFSSFNDQKSSPVAVQQMSSEAACASDFPIHNDSTSRCASPIITYASVAKSTPSSPTYYSSPSDTINTCNTVNLCKKHRQPPRYACYSSPTRRNNSHSKKADHLSQRQTRECNKSLYKTELCIQFERRGKCIYGSRCQFAHGRGELRSRIYHPKHKTVPCIAYFTTGICHYGSKCAFLHKRIPITEHHGDATLNCCCGSSDDANNDVALCDSSCRTTIGTNNVPMTHDNNKVQEHQKTRENLAWTVAQDVTNVFPNLWWELEHICI